MMAVEPIVASLISNLSSLALEEANRITNLEEHIESLEKELLLMDPLMDSIQNMGQHDQIAAQWLHEAHLVFVSAEDVTSQYTRRLAKKKWVEILQFPNLLERHELALDLERVTLDIHACSQKGIKILNDRNLNLPFSSGQQATAEGNNIVSTSSTLNKLNEFLTENRNHLPDALLECLVSVREKMAPFDKFLQQVVEEAEAEAEAGLDERQKLWLQEIKDVFQLLEQSLLTFQCSKEKEKEEIISEESFSILMLMLRSLKEYEEDLKEKFIEIENRIDRITSRYDLYAIGEFKAKNGSSSRAIVPQAAIRRSLKNEESVKTISMILLAPLRETFEKILKDLFTLFWVLFDNNPSISSLLEMDLKLVKALIEDASKMGDSDKRLKVWLEQVMEIYHEMKNLDSNVKKTIQRKWGLGKMVGLHKISQDSKEIEKKIEDALVRKTRYDIESFVARNGNGVVEQQVHGVIQVGGSSAQSAMPNGKKKLEGQVQLMKELQLIDALLEDVSTMDKLDVRLKVWLQEILGVAQEAREIVEQDFRGIFRSFNFSKKMNKIRKRIDDISEWKTNYSIHGISERNGQSRISYNLEAAEAYPSGHIAAEFESLRREVKLMKALETDIQEMVGLDGKLKAWMEEMHGVIADVDKFIHEHDEITRRRGTGTASCILIQEITTLQRHWNSVVHCKEKIQELHGRRIRYGIESINTSSSTNVVEEPPQVNLILGPAGSETTSTMPESNTSTMNHENVSPYLWRCLFHFLLFPVGKEIPARRLIAVWIAEGIVSPKRGENKPAEHFCQLRLSELTERGMIEATSWKINGKVRTYKLCDNMRETLSERAKAANFFKDATNNTTFRFAHHAADGNNPIDGSRPCSSSVLKSHYKKVISFFSFDTTEGRKHGEKLGNFLHRCIANRCFKSMRVLDLERVFKPKLPSAIGALTGLRYLGLRWTYLESLPDNVSKLLNLLVLDVKRTYISTLPKSIWSMQYLRHLYLSETYRTRFVSQPRKNNNKSLNDLLTLWGAFIDEDSPVVNGLDTIHNLRKLGLTCRSMSSSPLSKEKMKSRLEEVGDWITKLENLEDLRLKSFDDLDRPSDLHLKPFSGHTNLSTVYLVGRLRYPTIVSGTGFPVSITGITLSNSELEFDPMAALQSLPNLKFLRLLAKSTKCRKMECCRTQQVRCPFPKLQVLKIWSLENFDEWKLGEGALPNLKDLEIRNCHKLETIPYEIKNLQALSKFWLSHKFEEEIKTNHSTLWNEKKHLFEFSEE